MPEGPGRSNDHPLAHGLASGDPSRLPGTTLDLQTRTEVHARLIAARQVHKFSSDNELVGQADIETPGMLAIHPTSDLLDVGRSMAR